MPILSIANLVSASARDLRNTQQPINDGPRHLAEAIDWLCRAQDATEDGGVSEGYHLYHGWLPSYPETSGYIIETLLDYAQISANKEYSVRAFKIADWLVTLQHDDGAIPDSYLKDKMVFDTGQVLFGFARAFDVTGDEKYRSAGARAARWLCACMDQDGTWKRHALNGIPHTYYSRVAWSLLEQDAVDADAILRDAAVKNIRWVMNQQGADGWFENASFTIQDHNRPYTHTIAYTIRGVLECGMRLQDDTMITCARRAADALLEHIPADGRLAGTFGPGWQGDKRFSCLTGNAQMSVIFSRLFELSGEDAYGAAAGRLNAYLKTRQDTVGADERKRGAIAGSFPIWGSYIHFCYPNWAAKFFADALLLEEKKRAAA